jgi:amino acid adenylation domain-containing protein
VCAERSPNAIVALAAIAKSGGAFVPLDPASPDERLRIVLDDVRPAVVVVDASLAHRFTANANANTTIRTFDQLFAAAARESEAPLTFERTPRDLAYVLYTSGSTGAPKGVMIEHRSVCNTLAAAIADFALDGADRVLQLAPLSFDPSIWQIFGTWAAGGCVVLPPPGAERDPDEIAADIRTHRVSVLIGVAHGTALRIAVSGGSSVSPALRDRFRARDLPLYNVYGPTEASIQVTTHPCAGDDERPFVPLGAAIANMRVDVLDADRVPVAAGEIGELYLGGIGVARGYLHRDALTAERFVPDPRASEPDARMYRTGDLGRLHADGAIEFVGRVDDQVKVRGVRIELDEIGGVLESHPQVRSAVAVVSDDRIHAFVIARTADDALPTELRAHARSMLAPAAVPATVTLIDAFPVQPSGKVDRAALVARRLTAPVTRRAAPPDPLSAVLAGIWEDHLTVSGKTDEVALAAGDDRPARRPDRVAVATDDAPLLAIIRDQLRLIWETLLGHSDIGDHDDFLDLGGDSLLAVRLMMSLEETFGRRVPLADFFETMTIAGLSTLLSADACADVRDATTFNDAGTQPPLVYLHGDFAGGLYAWSLASILGADQPVIVIPPHGMPERPPATDVPSMAADAVTTIARLYPEGPLRIGGYSAAGLVAYEAACLLRAAGRTVDDVIVIGMEAAPVRYAGVVGLIRRLPIAAPLRESLVRFTLANALRAARLARLPVGDVIARTGAALRRHAGSPPATTASNAMETSEAFQRYIDAHAAYVPQPYAGRVLVLWPNEQPLEDGKLRDWLRVAPQAAFATVPGTHHGAVSRHLNHIAWALTRRFGDERPSD